MPCALGQLVRDLAVVTLLSHEDVFLEVGRRGRVENACPRITSISRGTFVEAK
jgi:hypothetical protein